MNEAPAIALTLEQSAVRFTESLDELSVVVGWAVYASNGEQSFSTEHAVLDRITRPVAVESGVFLEYNRRGYGQRVVQHNAALGGDWQSSSLEAHLILLVHADSTQRVPACGIGADVNPAELDSLQ